MKKRFERLTRSSSSPAIQFCQGFLEQLVGFENALELANMEEHNTTTKKAKQCHTSEDALYIRLDY